VSFFFEVVPSTGALGLVIRGGSPVCPLRCDRGLSHPAHTHHWRGEFLSSLLYRIRRELALTEPQIWDFSDSAHKYFG